MAEIRHALAIAMLVGAARVRSLVTDVLVDVGLAEDE